MLLLLVAAFGQPGWFWRGVLALADRPGRIQRLGHPGRRLALGLPLTATGRL